MSGHGHTASTKSLYIIFGSTLIFGFITGVIVFLQNNTGEKYTGSNEVPTHGFSILANMYGGCVRGAGCPSYRILSDGTFEYRVQNGEAGEVRYGDTLPDTQFKVLQRYIGEVDFPTVQKTKFEETCPVTFDGVAYRYTIQYEGVTYTLDSCSEKLEGQFFIALQNYFNVFASMYAIK